MDIPKNNPPTSKTPASTVISLGGKTSSSSTSNPRLIVFCIIACLLSLIGLVLLAVPHLDSSARYIGTSMLSLVAGSISGAVLQPVHSKPK